MEKGSLNFILLLPLSIPLNFENNYYFTEVFCDDAQVYVKFIIFIPLRPRVFMS